MEQTQLPLDHDRCYTALLGRDADYDGVFYVGVKTTGIFCRPTCPARKPKRENCEFFADAQAALLAAYRPCARCRPLSHPNETSDVVRRLVAAVEREPLKRWRDADFDALAVHASTARRQFRKRFGMTFVEYARARRLGSAFKAIRAGERVIDAQLDAGFDSPSGFRDAFARIMGAPPANRTTRALFAAWIDTPLGPMTAVADERALYLLEFVDRRGLEREIERLRHRHKAGIAPGRTAPIAQIEAELAAYFAGRSMTLQDAASARRLAVPERRLGRPAHDSARRNLELRRARARRRPAAGRARRRNRQRREPARDRDSVPPRDQHERRARRLRRRPAAQALVARARAPLSCGRARRRGCSRAQRRRPTSTSPRRAAG